MPNLSALNGAAINAGTALDEEAYQLWLRDPSAAVAHLVEIDYRGSSAVYPNWITYTLKLSDMPFPPYKDVIKNLPSFTRQIGEDFTGAVSASIGELVLDNTDGSLDLWHNLSLDGQKVRVFHGDPSWAAERFRLMFECVSEVVSSSTWDTLTIRLRGIDYGANLPIQTNLIPVAVGANAAASQPIPLAFGKVFNVSPALIDEVNQVYQWHDGAVTSVSEVRDSGIPFRTNQIAISAVNSGTDTLSTAAAHGFYRDTRVRCDLGSMPTLASWYAIAWNGSVFCAPGFGSSIAATSPDGITWTQRTMPVSAEWISIAWNGSVFCAVSFGSSIAATSPDGITWTQRTMPVSSAWYAIAWNGSVFCAISHNSNIAATSPDGITWTQRTMPLSTGWRAIAWNGSVFCVVVDSLASDVVATSPDGITWTQHALPTTLVREAIAWNGSVFCTVAGSSYIVVTSPDGITWSPATNTLPAPLAINTDYWVSAEGLTTTDFKLSASRGGSVINITGSNTGAPLIGFHWTADLTTGKVYLDSVPAGTLTLDGVANETTAAEILPTVLNTNNVDASSKSAFLATCPQTVGIYIKERRNRLSVAEDFTDGLGAWHGGGRAGLLRFGRIESSYTGHDHALTEDDMLFHAFSIERMVPPRKRNRVQYRRNWTNQTGSLAAGVSAENRSLFSSDYSISAPQPLGADEGPAGEQYHALAVIPDAKPSLLALAADAAAENARLDALFYGWGAIFACEVGRIGTEIDIGQVVLVTHSRFGNSGGARMPVVYVQDRPSAGTTALKFFAPLAAYAPGQI